MMTHPMMINWRHVMTLCDPVPRWKGCLITVPPSDAPTPLDDSSQTPTPWLPLPQERMTHPGMINGFHDAARMLTLS